MTWLPYAQFVLSVIGTAFMGIVALYVRAIKAEMWNKIFEEADRRYVAIGDCTLSHAAEIARLREEIVIWRTQDRHSMRNEVTVCLGQVEERVEERMDELKAEITRIRDRVGG